MQINRRYIASGLELSGFGRPFGLGFDASGRLYVTDMDVHRVFRFDSDLTHVQWLMDEGGGWSLPHLLGSGIAPRQRPTGAPSRFNGPHSIDFGPDGRIYVTTYYTPGIHVLDPDGKMLARIGGPGSAHRLTGPATAFFDPQGNRLVVAEYDQNAVLAFDADGGFIGGAGLGADGRPTVFSDVSQAWRASSRAGGFDRLHMVRALPGGTLIVADTWNHRLQRLDSHGAFEGWLGADMDGRVAADWSSSWTAPGAGKADGAFNTPVAIDVDSSGERLLVTEWGSGRLQIFDYGGHHQQTIAGLGLERPYDGRFWRNGLAIADSHNGRVLLTNCLPSC